MLFEKRGSLSVVDAGQKINVELSNSNSIQTRR